ncbi:Indolepyruvate ferredoxin oxidoreductase [Rhodovulum sp. PH10]|uniref:indolepyruvate ferredoxin oxidoreductase family protein n=1 Tax=Rhodovulum sp. PH10 TaxID=1187851 RepID=UPI00027C2ACA|nr:indolepyruvate ferredoxin oxidoreductase family protein [Rhodovulum sp. PH10]EJW10073.1 Indolepyruvate ferredoxin oxidoreductase [Rhodovulum sp. PH10]
MALRPVTLDDKYDLTKSPVLVTGYQAIIRMCLMQKARDRRAGLRTAGYVTGYRGSPLGGLDQQFLRVDPLLKANDILFQPGLNEDLAATAVWGSQQAELRGEGRFDGVFGLWYGKGPGVDRSGDVFRHANCAGTSRHGGVLALMGDDHTAESSTTAHQSEFNFVNAVIPVLNPAGVQEILDYGLLGIAMSRFTGAWVGLKCVHETVESTAVVDGDLDRVRIVSPGEDAFRMPPGGLSIRLGDTVLGQEARLQDFKRDAMLAFSRANKLNRTVISGGRAPKIGVVTVGKSYLDVRLALDRLGLDEVRCNDLGVRLVKIGCPYPIGRDDMLEAGRGLDLLIVVEEKRSLVEVQVREELYGTANQPMVVGKKDEQGRWLFPVKGALDVDTIALAIGERLLAVAPNEELVARVAAVRAAAARTTAPDLAVRVPYFCSGCPHNTSTKVPEGSRAYAGIGCHYMVQWMDRATTGFTQMGGEGANWVGEAPFSKRPHIFQNLGDGTYTHSGSLAIRAAIASGVSITFKILYNDAVAMTGGQRSDTGLTVPQIATQVAAEGVTRIAVVSDEPDKYPKTTTWPPGTTVHHRETLDDVQRDLSGLPGTSVLIYDQTCAAEKRRRRKRGLFPDPDRRVVINELVCEGCGDCGVQSNCVSIQPRETEFGRKRMIDQTTCNKDFSCVQGFCPSFASVSGARPKKAKAVSIDPLSLARSEPAGTAPALPLPASGERGGVRGDFAGATDGLPTPTLPKVEKTYGILVTGIGGTGIVTVGAILGMAAHLEGKAAGVIDMAGLAQKGGSVHSHIRIAARPEDIQAIRLPAHGADLFLGGDLVIAAGHAALATVRPGATKVVVNTAEVLPGAFTKNPDYRLPTERLKAAITTAARDSSRDGAGDRSRDESGDKSPHFLDATKLATALTGQSIAANLFLLGYAYQIGGVPLSAEAIESAIALNGEAVAMNLSAFRWGRRAAHDLASVEVLVAPAEPDENSPRRPSKTLEETVERRVAFLTAYQSARYASRYRALVARVAAAERERTPEQTGLTLAVARSLFKLMAYKDEYEVARLWSDGSFLRQLASDVDGEKLRLTVHLAPPLIARRDRHGHLRKMTFGPWIFPVFRALSRLKILRSTPLDPFGHTEERRTERALIADYEAMLDEVLTGLTPDNHALAVALAAVPEKIRGFGHVKMRAVAAAKAEEATLLAEYRAGPAATLLQAAE